MLVSTSNCVGRMRSRDWLEASGKMEEFGSPWSLQYYVELDVS
jgi:hypothetical protein